MIKKPLPVIGFLVFALFVSGLFIQTGLFAEVVELPRVSFSVQGFKNPFEADIPQKEPEAVQKQQEPEKVVEQVFEPAIDIQGIVWGGRFPQAIINEKVISVGDVIDFDFPVTVLEIEPKKVTVLYKSKIFTYSL